MTPAISSSRDSDSSHPSPPAGNNRKESVSNSNSNDTQQKRSRNENMSSSNNNSNSNSNSNKGYAYSCTGLSIYSSDRRAKQQLPTCIGITGRLKEVELIHDRRKDLKQKKTTNIAHRKSLSPVLPPTKEAFQLSCIGYSRIILQSMQDQRQQQGSKSPPFQISDGKVIGLPICEVGVNFMSNVVQPAMPLQTSDRKKSSYDEVVKEQQDRKPMMGSHNDEEDIKDEESMDREIKKIRERYRQVLDQNETDPNTWKRREQLERHRRLMMRQQQQLQQQKMMEKLKQEQKKRQSVAEEKGTMDSLSVSLAKWKKYALKLPLLTYAEMKRNGTTIYTELTHKDLPRRVWNSSERIVQHFGSSARLCQKAFSRSKDTVMESLNYLYRTGKGSDKKK
jgi:hypothetical protein